MERIPAGALGDEAFFDATEADPAYLVDTAFFQKLGRFSQDFFLVIRLFKKNPALSRFS